MLVDTHSHLYVSDYNADREETLQRALAAGIEIQLLPAIDSSTHDAMIALAEVHPKNCLPMMGFHPTSVDKKWRMEMEITEAHLASGRKFYGIGETGIDLYHSREFIAQQKEAFEAQIELAIKYDLPLVIHCRSAWFEVFGVLEKYKNRGLRGVFHAFSGGVEEYVMARRMGDFAIGITGVATYKKRPLDDVIFAAEPQHILLETDCPYLTPEPHRGVRNESAYLKYVCNKVAEVRGKSPEEIGETTTSNARRIFGF